MGDGRPVPSDQGSESLVALAKALLKGADATGALAAAERALRSTPDSADAYRMQALALVGLGRRDEAVDAFRLCVHYAPGSAAVHLRLGMLLRELGRHRSAQESLERALALAPDAPGAWHELGLVRFALGDVQAAVDAFGRALAIEPRNAQLLSDLGYALLRQPGRVDDALARFDAALALDPDCADALVNRGTLWQELGAFERALADFERALRLRELPEARLNRALLRLMDHDWTRGWRDYEVRLLVQAPDLHRRHPLPRWDGGSLSGRAILVYGEQGLGDEIMFASCLPDLVACAGNVIVQCAPRLARLFARSFPRAHVRGVAQEDTDRGWLAGLPAPHVVSGIGSLPRHLRRNDGEFPVTAGYLRADPGRIAAWRERLAAPGPGRTLGLSWRGGTPATRRAARSIELAALLPMLRLPGVRWVSLQYGDSAAERAALAASHGVTLAHWQAAVDDPDETAALICALDGVVSVCTAAAHMTGALGRPLHVLVPAVPEWRYGRRGARIPWYPSATLYRQTTTGDWRDVIEQVTRTIAAGAS